MPTINAYTYVPVGDHTWMNEANCRDVGPSTFYDWEGQRQPRGAETLAAARSFCRECDVQSDCLAFALNNFSVWFDFGVWGGTTPEQRARLRRARRSA